MQILKKVKNLFKSRLKLAYGTRLVSFLFIACSIIIAGGILFAANMYYNIDTGEIVMEQIQRVTQVVRATGGLIVGGAADENPAAGYGFEVATSTLFSSGDVVLSAANQVLKISGGTSYYIGITAPTTVTSSKTYILPQHGTSPPSADYTLTWQSGDQLQWKEIVGIGGVGDITAVGDVSSGAAFTSGGDQGTSLWFYDAQGRGQLTIADLTAATTYTLPDLTGVVALQQEDTLTAGGVLLADSLGRIIQDTDFTYSTSTDMLQVGGGGIKFLGSTSGYIGLEAAAASDSTTYTWPASDGSTNYVLTTDSSGVLEWKSVIGAGGVDVTGSPLAGHVTFFYDSDTITGESNLFWDSTSSYLGIGTSSPAYALDVVGTARLSTSLIAPLIQYTGGSLTLQTLSSGEIILDSADNIIRLGTGDVILTQGGGPASRPKDELILREMIPILGFDLPAQTATTSYVQISRVLEDYPFASVLSGTTRVHKFVIRYADATTTASTTWRAYNEADSTTTATFETPATASTDLGKGEAYITSDVTIPTDDDDWRLDLMTSGATIRVYQIFLAAYDKVD